MRKECAYNSGEVYCTAVYDKLQTDLKSANYDAALNSVLGLDLLRPPFPPTNYARLRFACMVADVYQYGGLYDRAEWWVQNNIGNTSDRLLQVHSANDICDPAECKQECWALMMRGMCLYRKANPYDYKAALKFFECAGRVLQMLHDSGTPCLGSRARASYCIGLVERQQHRYDRARRAFRKSIEFAETGLRSGTVTDSSELSFKFNLARCLGLGIGWIAYNEARLADAMVSLVTAHSMIPPGTRFIYAYIDVIRASIMLSEATAYERADEAIELLDRCFEIFTGQLGGPHKICHAPYALRTQNELALGHLRSARLSSPDQRKKHLDEAETCLRRVKSPKLIKAFQTLQGVVIKADARTRAQALITEARLRRYIGELAAAADDLATSDADALRRDSCAAARKLAEEAKKIGGDLKFTFIDACIGIGEAAFGLNDFLDAVEHFALALKEGKDSPKVAAVCHLHLCRAYLRANELPLAREHFNSWELMQPRIENAFVLELATLTRQELSLVYHDFELRKDQIAPQTPHKVYVDKLLKWLADTTLIIENGDTAAAAERLAVDTASINRWRKFRS